MATTSHTRKALTTLLVMAAACSTGCMLPNMNPGVESAAPRELLVFADRKIDPPPTTAPTVNADIDEADEPPLPGVEYVSYEEEETVQPGTVRPPHADDEDGEAKPIDLSTALALGGANHLQIQMAREKVLEAGANLQAAKAAVLPSLRFGIGWNKHDGKLQETEGNVLEINRNSLFVGGGAGLGSASLAGGASGPSRLVVNLSLADALFEPLVARRMLDAHSAAESATVNDALLEIAVAYFDLVEAHGDLANAEFCRDMAERLVRLTRDFAETGAGSQADVDRAEVELAERRQQVQDARRRTGARSAELARLLRLGPSTRLAPVEDRVMPIDLIEPETSDDVLLAHGMANRPELAKYDAMVAAAEGRTVQEFWRPWLPNIQAGASGGTFGGGPSNVFNGQGSRSDVDVLAVWEIEGLGYGVRANRLRRDSQLRQAQYESDWFRDHIVAEIVTAAGDVRSYRRQIHSAMQSVKSAADSCRRNQHRVRAGDGLPIELLQAIRARCSALDAYTRAVTNYNRAQFRLLRALGRPPGMSH